MVPRIGQCATCKEPGRCLLRRPAPLSYLGLPYVEAVAEERQHQGPVQRGGLGARQVDKALDCLQDLVSGHHKKTWLMARKMPSVCSACHGPGRRLTTRKGFIRMAGECRII